MTRIQFNSLQSYQKVQNPLPKGHDRGIRVHSSFQAAIRNFFSLFGLCSTVFQYKVGKKSLYINRASFNHWLERRQVEKVSKKNCNKLAIVQDAVLRALNMKSKFEEVALPHLDESEEPKDHKKKVNGKMGDKKVEEVELPLFDESEEPKSHKKKVSGKIGDKKGEAVDVY